MQKTYEVGAMERIKVGVFGAYRGSALIQYCAQSDHAEVSRGHNSSSIGFFANVTSSFSTGFQQLDLCIDTKTRQFPAANSSNVAWSFPASPTTPAGGIWTGLVSGSSCPGFPDFFSEGLVPNGKKTRNPPQHLYHSTRTA